MAYTLNPPSEEELARRDAEEALSRAVWLVRRKKYLQALDIFEEHLELLDRPEDSPERLRLLSFYGLCLAMVWGQAERALALCAQAVERCRPEAGLHFNLGMVLLRQRQRERALESFREGLRIDPAHEELHATLERLHPRSRPIFPFLERRHPLNKLTGLLRSRVTRIWSASDPVSGIPTRA